MLPLQYLICVIHFCHGERIKINLPCRCCEFWSLFVWVLLMCGGLRWQRAAAQTRKVEAVFNEALPLDVLKVEPTLIHTVTEAGGWARPGLLALQSRGDLQCEVNMVWPLLEERREGASWRQIHRSRKTTRNKQVQQRRFKPLQEFRM